MLSSQTHLVSMAIAAAIAVLVLLAGLTERRWPRLAVLWTALFVGTAAGAGYAWSNLGEFRSRVGLVHSHEQFHFYLGSKYLPEVRYDGLYLATMGALEESMGKMPAWTVRSLHDFTETPRAEVEQGAADVRQRFSDDRWAAFVTDVTAFRKLLHTNLRRVVGDHGNTGSPAWASAVLPATRSLSVTVPHANMLGAIDPALLLVLFGLCWRSFGLRTAALVLAASLLPMRIFSYLGGSILRMDWIFALGASAALLGRRHRRLAGLLLGYAIATKAFCGLVALALGVRFVATAIQQRRVAREHVTVVLWAVIGLVTAVLGSALVFGGLDIWRDYLLRILESLHEAYYRGQYSFRDVYLQLAHDPLAALVEPLPKVVQAGRKVIDVTALGPGVWVARALMLAALSFVIARNDEVFAYGVGVLFVFTLLVTNIYYWQFFLLLAIALGRRGAPGRHTLLLAATFALIGLLRLPALENWPLSRHGYFGSFWLWWFCVAMVGLELWSFVREWRGLRARALGG